MKDIASRQVEAPATGGEASSVRWVLVSLSLSMLLSSLGTSIPNVALPTFARVFSASFQEVQWIVISYLLAITVVIVSAGRLGDLVGHTRVLRGGIALFTVASVLCGVSQSLWMLVAARAVQGVGAAVLMALTVALVRETVPKKSTGSAMGLLGTVSAIGTALGPSVGGALVAGPGWRAIFLVMAPLGLVAYVLALRCLPLQAPRQARGGNVFDKPGTLLLGVTLAAYALAVTVGAGRFDELNVALGVVAVVGAALFLFVQARVASPLIRLAEFRDPVLRASLAMNVLVPAVMMATLVVGPFFLARALGLPDALVGLVMAVGPLISTVSGVPAGKIVDRMGAPFIVVAGLVEMTVGVFALALLPSMYGIAGYIVAIVILTPGYQLFQAANNTAVMIDVSAERRGVVSGMLSLARNLGLITGASVMGALFAHGSMSPDISTAAPQAVAEGMRVTFIVAGGLVVLALGIAAVGMRRPKPVPSTS